MFSEFNTIYKNKKVFLTGHTGFKGGWLTIWLKKLGADILGYSLEPDDKPCFYDAVDVESHCRSVFGDILDRKKLEKTMLEFKPDIVFHLAAQPLVRLSYSQPVLTYETNVMGTLNVLEAARKCTSVRAFVNITTDKCYENKEIERGYKEDEPMGGHDMYSSSKGCVEIMSSSYRRSFLQNGEPYAMATARAGNVIGGGDWALDRLVPDCIRFINEGKPIEIRNPNAIRPWQHVLEPLSGYLLLGQKLLGNTPHPQGRREYSGGFNFGPNEESFLTVADVAQKVADFYGKGKVRIGKNGDLHEAGLLMLNIEKAKNVLGWAPKYSAEQAILKTVEWYKKYYNGENMAEFTLSQIEDYNIR